MYSDEGTKTSVDPKTSSSPSPNMSTISNHNNSSQSVKSSPNVTSNLKNDFLVVKSVPNATSTLKSDSPANNSSVEVRSYSSSQKENTSSNAGDNSQSAAREKTSPKITEFSSLSSVESQTGKGSSLVPKSNFKIFSKLKSAMLKVNNNTPLKPGTDSSVHVGSMSSSSSGHRSSGSSFMNGIKSKLIVGSGSSSPKESSSNTGSSTIPLVVIDINEQLGDLPSNPEKSCPDYIDQEDVQKSEGFDLHDTKEFEVSSKTDSVNLEKKVKKRQKKKALISKICTVLHCWMFGNGDSLHELFLF